MSNRSTPSTPNTGSWRHPAMDTIVQRTKQKGPADINHNRLAKNLAALLGTYAFTWAFHAWLNRSKSPVYGQSQEIHPAWDDIIYYGGYLVNALRIILVCNILESGYRLTRKEPDFSDLALTPVQRKLLGLDPNVPSHAPPEGYITPPRYAKSSPSSATPNGNDNNGAGLSSSNYRPSSPGYSAYTTTTSTSTYRRPSFSAVDGPMTPTPLRSTHRGGMGQSLGFSVNTTSSTNSMQNSYLNSPSPQNRTGPGYGLGYGHGHGHVNGYGIGASGLPVGNKWIYEKMARKGEGSRWVPGRSSIFNPFRG